MKQLYSLADLVNVLDLDKPIIVQSARQNGSTFTGAFLSQEIARSTGRDVRVEELFSGEAETTFADISNPSVGELVNIHVMANTDNPVTDPNYVVAYRSDNIQSIVAYTATGVYHIHLMKQSQHQFFLDTAYKVVDKPILQRYTFLNCNFLTLMLEGKNQFLEILKARLDFSKPVAVVSHRPHQGGTTLSALIGALLADEEGTSIDALTSVLDIGLIGGMVFNGKPLSNVALKIGDTHYLAGLTTIQQAEYQLEKWFETIGKGVVIVDELVPSFEIPPAARANAVSADIFQSSARIRFATTLEGHLERHAGQEGGYSIMTSTGSTTGLMGAEERSLQLRPNSIVTYLNDNCLSLLVLGTDGYVPMHLTVGLKEENGSRILNFEYDVATCPEAGEVHEMFTIDTGAAVRHYNELREAEEFEKNTAERSLQAELEAQAKPNPSVGLI